ncbi:unnamed protein product [Rotaria magnacalcarata]|uniref:Nuclear receptor domain-containing protein n=1 Tax=Rotaria magnacalcarata TaxID=392030 RepID=A0A816Y9H0_9BILA|nr:unnamed protein product [Rotaria magnacalcarata]CAF1630306.1 unnamed protein product [Rotaria magnacalcarata]CAF1951148.1 unnamed protein product [Rotaria magnacalcarata]CAF2145826.1 unnamed protein product [Rotaria magnacalcarata]CAF2157187.1 unnamed protein product [Rotaria magnacalcarata]
MLQQLNTSTSFSDKPRRGRKKRRKDVCQCLVCGDISIGINFGIHTCSPCKAFFRRNAIKLGIYEFVCDKDGHCPITRSTRRKCNCCRLAKCFQVGMNPNAIRSAEEKLERNQLIEYNRQRKLEKSTKSHAINLSQHILKTNFSLSSTDEILLTNIFNAYEQTCAPLRYKQHLKMSHDEISSLEKLLNSISHMYLALVDYLKYVPEFSNLSIDTKICILKSNFNQIFRLNNALIIHATGADDDLHSATFKNLFPTDLYVELCNCISDLLPYVHDPIFLKLVSIVFIFSTSLTVRFDINPETLNTKTVLSIQNIYIELLWRWIQYRCSTYEESVRLFTSFITHILHSQIVGEKLSEYVNKMASKHADQLVPIMKAMWLEEKN